MGDEILKELRSLTTAAVVEKKPKLCSKFSCDYANLLGLQREFDYRFRKIIQQGNKFINLE